MPVALTYEVEHMASVSFFPYLTLIRCLRAFNSLKNENSIAGKFIPVESRPALLDLVSCCYFAVVSTLKSLSEWVLIGTKIKY